MAIQHFDGFDDYSTAQISRYWNSQVSSSGQTISSAGGRNSSGAFVIVYASGAGNVSKTLAASSTFVTGFALKITTTTVVRAIMAYTSSGTAQAELRINTDMTLSVTRNSTAVTGGTSTLALTPGTWYYIEFKCKFLSSISSGDVVVNVNGVQWISVSAGQSVNNAGTGTATGVALGDLGGASGGGGITATYDDVYMDNGTSFLGDCRVETKLPTGNGATNNFTRGGTDSGTNWGQVDENPGTDDTDYVLTAGANNTDEYTYPALSTTAGAVKAVMTVPVMRTDNAGTVTVASVYRSGGTDYFGASNNVGSTTYAPYTDIQTTDPNTSAAWTVSGVNACQFGVKRTA